MCLVVCKGSLRLWLRSVISLLWKAIERLEDTSINRAGGLSRHADLNDFETERKGDKKRPAKSFLLSFPLFFLMPVRSFSFV